jgi:ABC-type ATPase with predicted acetyltransferase domain
MRQEDCWIGCTARSGPLIFDPHLQDGMSAARVRFWDVWQKKVVVFDKHQIRRELASLRLQVRSYEDEERLIWELRTAIAEYKRWLAGRKVTRCYRCKLYLDSLSEEPCADCGWLRCRCGACGCSYFRGR